MEGLGIMVHTSNLSFSGGGDGGPPFDSRPAQGREHRLYLKNKLQKKGLGEFLKR
jgi:hypothetical protein